MSDSCYQGHEFKHGLWAGHKPTLKKKENFTINFVIKVRLKKKPSYIHVLYFRQFENRLVVSNSTEKKEEGT